MTEIKSPIGAHFQELKKRVLLALATFAIAFGCCYPISDKLYRFLLAPLATLEHNNDQFSLIYTDLTEAFFVYLRVSYLSALMISCPIWAWQLYAFISPGLYKQEKKFVAIYFVATPVLFVSGAALVYYYIFPIAWKFFIDFEEMTGAKYGVPVEFMPSVSEYLDLVVHLMFAFGAAFQLPVILTLLCKIKVLSADILVKKRRFSVVLIFIVAAVLTPPDVISQIGLAIPMMILYELSILACRYMEN